MSVDKINKNKQHSFANNLNFLFMASECECRATSEAFEIVMNQNFVTSQHSVQKSLLKFDFTRGVGLCCKSEKDVH